MIHIKGIENFKSVGPTAVTIGKFDALHLGHRELISRAVSKKSIGLTPVCIIFSASPRIVLGKEKEKPKFIITKEERKEILSSLGIEVLLEIPFDERLINTSAEDFIMSLCKSLSMEYFVTGKNFHFGRGGEGDSLFLSGFSKKAGFVYDCVHPLEYRNETISSTRIRNEISNGVIKRANEMLGYEYFIKNPIDRGNMLGRTIDFPTINVKPSLDKITPPLGVYATLTEIEGKVYPGMTNLGIRPTIEEREKRVVIETHLFDVSGDFYDKEAKVRFVEYVRPEIKFPGMDALREQIGDDMEVIRGIFHL